MSKNNNIMMLGFPRSGNNWLRYIIESIYNTKTCTFGNEYHSLSTRGPLSNVCNIQNKKDAMFSYCYHLHLFDIKRNYSDLKNIENMIFITRNPFESVLRHHFIDKIENQEKINLSELMFYLRDDQNSWINHLKYFDEFCGKKTILKYDKLIDLKNNQDELEKLSNFFLQFDNQDVNKIKDNELNFINNLEIMKENSKKSYNINNKTYSQKYSNYFSLLPKRDREQIRKSFLEDSGSLLDKYDIIV